MQGGLSLLLPLSPCTFPFLYITPFSSLDSLTFPSPFSPLPFPFQRNVPKSDQGLWGLAERRSRRYGISVPIETRKRVWW